VATNGVDYESLSGVVTIPAGQASATITLKPYDDTLAEGAGESVYVQLDVNPYAPAYTIDPLKDEATATIADNDQPGQPDLVVTLLMTSGQPVAGQTVVVSGVIQNQGNGPAAAGFLSRLKANASIVQPIEATTAALPAGDSVTFGWSWTPSSAGSVTLELCADMDLAVNESNESNNCRTAVVSVAAPALPDLIAADLALSPLNAVVGKTISFSGAIENRGEAAAGVSFAVFCVDSSAEACYQSQTGLAGPPRQVMDIDPGALKPVLGTGSWTANAAGSHTVYLCADGGKNVAESQEGSSSNCVSKTFTVYSVPAGQPDLAVIDLAWSPADPAPGASVSFTVTVTNYGTAATEAMRIGCHLGSPSGTLLGESWLITFMPGETRAIACGSRSFSAGAYDIVGVVETEGGEAVSGDDVGSEKLRVD